MSSVLDHVVRGHVTLISGARGQRPQHGVVHMQQIALPAERLRRLYLGRRADTQHLHAVLVAVAADRVAKNEEQPN